MFKIAQVGPIWYDIPPKTYGGTERVVFNLTEELVKRGHEVTLFASGTSHTSAHLQSLYPKALSDLGIPGTNLTYVFSYLANAIDQADKFDILHIHLSRASDYVAFPLAQGIKDKIVFTNHFPYPDSANQVDRHQILQRYKDLNFTSISNAQRRGGENLNWIDTVYNGIDINNLKFNANAESYVCWIGRFAAEKGALEAIHASKEAGLTLKMAGNVDTLKKEDKQYFEEHIKPHIDGKQVEFLGEINEEQKNTFLGSAQAFLMPIKWNEPFGLVMAEALACGTPVIAFNNGAAPEIIKDGETGFIVKDVNEMALAIKKSASLDRIACRSRVEAMFTSEKMADNYLKVYEKIIKH